MDVLVTSKNKGDPNKNEGARVATTLNIDFSHRQGQIRPKIKSCLFAIAYLPTIFPPTQKILLGFLEEFFFFFN